MQFTLETDYHTIDFTSKKAYKEVDKVCKEMGITIDHYFFEFDTSDTEPEAYIQDIPYNEFDDPLM